MIQYSPHPPLVSLRVFLVPLVFSILPAYWKNSWPQLRPLGHWKRWKTSKHVVVILNLFSSLSSLEKGNRKKLSCRCDVDLPCSIYNFFFFCFRCVHMFASAVLPFFGPHCVDRNIQCLSHISFSSLFSSFQFNLLVLNGPFSILGLGTCPFYVCAGSKSQISSTKLFK